MALHLNNHLFTKIFVMKKTFYTVAVIATMSLTSCATILGGKVSDCQRTKPAPGEPSRKIRPVALIGSAMFGVLPVVIDFATGAIYKPCKTEKKDEKKS